MSRQFLTSIDLNKNQMLNAALQNLAAAPALPVSGQVYWDTTANRHFYWNAVALAWQNKATDSDLLATQLPSYYLNRVNHTGQQIAATISDLQATVMTYTLDTLTPPVAPMNMNGQRVTNVGTPTAATDAATKGYVDTNMQGLKQKPTAMVATAAPLPTCVYANGAAGLGASLTATANGILTVDGYAVALGDVILVKDEVTLANNGLYDVLTLGSATVPYVLRRNPNMDQGTEFGGGFIPVENFGATTKNSLWLCNVAAAIVVGTSAVSFVQLNTSTALTAGNGFNIAGLVGSVVAAPSGGIVVTPAGVGLDTTSAVRKYATAVGDGAATTYTITHNLGTQDVTVRIYAAVTPFAEVDTDIAHASANSIVLTFATAPTAGQYRVVVHG